LHYAGWNPYFSTFLSLFKTFEIISKIKSIKICLIFSTKTYFAEMSANIVQRSFSQILQNVRSGGKNCKKKHTLPWAMPEKP